MEVLEAAVLSDEIDRIREENVKEEVLPERTMSDNELKERFYTLYKAVDAERKRALRDKEYYAEKAKDPTSMTIPDRELNKVNLDKATERYDYLMNIMQQYHECTEENLAWMSYMWNGGRLKTDSELYFESAEYAQKKSSAGSWGLIVCILIMCSGFIIAGLIGIGGCPGWDGWGTIIFGTLSGWVIFAFISPVALPVLIFLGCVIGEKVQNALIDDAAYVGKDGKIVKESDKVRGSAKKGAATALLTGAYLSHNYTKGWIKK